MALAVLAYRWVSISLFIDMNQGLLAFLGLLAASIVQVIPVTANFVQSDRLTPEDARRISSQLSKQQRYWVGLLSSTIVTFAVIVVISVLKDRTEISLTDYTLSIGPAFSAAVTFCLAFLLLRMPEIISGVLSLQDLRNELVLSAALKNADEDLRNAESHTIVPSDIVPADYGSIVRH